MGKEKKVPTPKLHKTGTTLAGCVFEGGVVMGADTRATSGDTIAEKRCFKIHRITDNIYCCGSGTSADCDQVTTMTSTKMELHKLNTGRTPRVALLADSLRSISFTIRVMYRLVSFLEEWILLELMLSRSILMARLLNFHTQLWALVLSRPCLFLKTVGNQG